MVHRTMQGREIDLEKLMRQNELVPAIGNMKVNARGDELGPGGQIIRKREEIVAEYYENNPKTKYFVPKADEPVQQTEQAVSKSKKTQSEE